MTRTQLVRIACVGTMALACAVPALAQTEGRVGVGVSVTSNNTADGDVASAFGIGPLIRLNPRRGWGPAGAFNWYRADLDNPDGTDAPFARLHVRPLMAGIGYTFGPPTTLVNFSVVAGPSFNKASFEDEFRDQMGGNPLVEAKTSFAIRPGVSITQTVAPRVGVIGFAGYMVNRPEVIYRSTTGQQVEDRWRADTVVLSIGVVYSIF